MSGYPKHHRSWRRTLRLWGAVLAICLFGAAAAIGIRALLDSVGSARHMRYEPVDVPPESVSPRHERERGELERRDRAVSQRGQ